MESQTALRHMLLNNGRVRARCGIGRPSFHDRRAALPQIVDDPAGMRQRFEHIERRELRRQAEAVAARAAPCAELSLSGQIVKPP